MYVTFAKMAARWPADLCRGCVGTRYRWCLVLKRRVPCGEC